MKKRESFSKEGSKSKPFTVRFTQDFLDDIKERRQITNGQKIVTFLEYLYNQTFNPVVGNPVMERNVANLPKDELDRQTRLRERAGIGLASTSIRNPLGPEDCTRPNKPPAAPKPTKDKQAVNPKEEKPEKAPQNEPQEMVVAFRMPDNSKRIADLEKELLFGPPKELSSLGKKSWVYDRKKELENLKK